MSCIDINNVIIKQYSKELNLPRIIVGSFVSIYQRENNTLNFPSIDEIKSIAEKHVNENQSNVEETNNQSLTQFQKKNISNLKDNNTILRKDLIAEESAIRDLAARLAYRIGGEVEFIADKTKDYAGYNEGNKSVINLAYADLSTPVHEIVAHPIIRAIKNNYKFVDTGKNINKEGQPFLLGKIDIQKQNELYQNLLKELETGYGKEVLDRVKKEYVYKSNLQIVEDTWGTDGFEVIEHEGIGGKFFKTRKEAEEYVKANSTYYTLEEQQEEALVELVSEMVANKIKNTKENKNLIQLLKQLLKEISGYMRSLFNKKELDISKDLDNIDYLTNQKLNELMKKGLIDKNCN